MITAKVVSVGLSTLKSINFYSVKEARHMHRSLRWEEKAIIRKTHDALIKRGLFRQTVNCRLTEDRKMVIFRSAHAL